MTQFEAKKGNNFNLEVLAGAGERRTRIPNGEVRSVKWEERVISKTDLRSVKMHFNDA